MPEIEMRISRDVEAILEITGGPRPCIIDIETTSLSPSNGDILCIAAMPYKGSSVTVYWPRSTQDISRISCDKAVFHNAYFDAHWLRHYGANIQVYWDTMLMAHLLDENDRVSLKYLGSKILGYEDWSEEEIKNLEFLPRDRVSEYVCKDVLATHELLLWQRRYLRSNRLKPKEDPYRVMSKIMIPAIDPLLSMEGNKIPVRMHALKRVTEDTLSHIARITADLSAHIPPKDMWPTWIHPSQVKWGSNSWTRWWLYDYHGIQPPARGKPNKIWPEGVPSLSGSALALVDHPAAASLRELSGLRKVLTGFLIPLQERTVNGRVSTAFRIAGTVTGRISSCSPGEDNPGINSQQIPRDKSVRNLFGENKMAWIECDYSQLELRVAATLAQEETMLRLFREGKDIHTYMAQKLLHTKDITKEQRSLAKGVNFGFLYGMHAKHFMRYLRDVYGMTIDYKSSEQFREEYYTIFPKLLSWYKEQHKEAITYGGVHNAFGRFRHLPKVYDEDYWVQQSALRQSINAPVQSTGSDFMLISLARINESAYLKDLGAKLITTVHDSVEITAPYKTAVQVGKEVKRIMSLADDTLDTDFQLRADVTISRVWGGKPLKEF